MNAGSTRARNSRWDNAPVFHRGRPRVAAITERDIAGIFKPLLRHRYLPADYIHAFAGGSLDYVIDRLNLLSRRPNLYVARPHQQRANAGANHRRLVYELAEKGIGILQDRGLPCERPRAAGSFAHELLTSLIMASFELGVQETDASLLRWSDILDSPSLPEATRRSPKPFHIPATVVVDGQRIDTHIAADGHPFGVERAINGRSSYFFCPGVEADCGTEPVDASDFVRSSIARKFALYLAVDAQQTYRSHFGFPNFYVPIVTTNSARLNSMMKVLERVTGGNGSKMFLFKTLPAYTAYEPPRPPSGYMLREDWQRVGYPPFNFLTTT